jgi:hypothetical protein
MAGCQQRILAPQSVYPVARSLGLSARRTSYLPGATPNSVIAACRRKTWGSAACTARPSNAGRAFQLLAIKTPVTPRPTFPFSLSPSTPRERRRKISSATGVEKNPSLRPEKTSDLLFVARSCFRCPEW